MKTPILRFLAACMAVPLAAAPLRAQQALHVDTSGNPTIPLNLGGANISGTLGTSHVPAILQRGLVAEYRFDEGTGIWAANAARPAPAPSNLFYAGEEPNQAGGGSGYTPRYALDPFGGSLAARYTGTGALYPIPLTAGATYTMSVYLASNTGAAQKIRQVYNAGYSGDITIPATGWTRLVTTFTGNGVSYPLQWYGADAEGDANDLLVYGAQIEAGSAASQYEPGRANLAWPIGNPTPVWNSAGLDFTAAGGTALALLPNTNFAQATLYAVVNWPTANAAPNAGVTGLFGGDYNSQSPALRLSGGYATFTFGNTPCINPLTNLKDGNWHLLTGIHDGVSNRVFVDDVEMMAIPDTTAAKVLQFLELGCAEQYAGYGFPGQIAYASAYNVGHTTAQQARQFATISTLMAAKGVTLAPLSRLVVFEGDSITTGNGTATPYPNVVMPNLTPITQGRNFAAASATISGGSTPTNSLVARAPQVDVVFADAPAHGVLVVAAGHNDAGYCTAAQSYANYKAYCQARRPNVKKIIACSLLPSTVGGFNVWRAAWNALLYADIAAGGIYDGLIDWAADPTIGPDAAASNATYFPDGIHPTTAAHAIMAPIAQTAIAAALF